VKNFAAIKISIENIFTVVTDDEKQLMIRNKDTFRLKSKGAKKVAWIRSTRENLADALGKAFLLMENYNNILIEGNSILNHLTPDLVFFVFGGELKKMKPGAVDILQKADIIINNIRDESIEHDSIEKSLRALNAKASIASLNLQDEKAVLPFLRTVLSSFMDERKNFADPR
jgi:hypothetical protein